MYLNNVDHQENRILMVYYAYLSNYLLKLKKIDSHQLRFIM